MMYEHLDDPQPPNGADRRDAVLATAASRRRRRRFASGGAVVGLAAALVAALVLVPSNSGTSKLVTSPDSDAAASGRDVLPRHVMTAPPSQAPSSSTTTPARAKPSPTPRHFASARPAVASVPPSAAATTDPAHTPRPACQPSSGGTAPTPQSESAFKAQITYAWLLCDDRSVFGTSEDGLELRSDGRWSKLSHLSDGTYARELGYGSEGTWEVLDNGDMNGADSSARWQVNLHIDGSGTVITLPVFTSDLRTVKLEQADYQRLPDGSVSGAISPPPPASGEPADCTAAEGGEQAPANSQAAFEQKIEGDWQLCAKPSVFGSDEDGLEIRANHTWAKLARGSDGKYHPMTGVSDCGTWEAVDTGGMNGNNNPQRWQLNLSKKDGYEVITQPAFAVQTPKVRMSNGGVYTSDYVPLSAGAVVG